jgi:hypothetical protein
MNGNKNKIFAWVFFGLVAASVLSGYFLNLAVRPAGEKFTPASLVFALIPVSFAFVGALIISRQSRNLIGWLMMLPGVSMFVLVDAYLAPFISGQIPPPASPSPLFLIIVWFSNWNWLLLVFPILFIMILFPTGKPLSPRWRWLIIFGLFLCALLVGLGTFAEQMAPSGAELDWSLRNPIGFLDDDRILPVFISFWFISLPVFVILSAASLFVRFFRSRGVEREQIKWLFYACVLFALVYVPPFFLQTYQDIDNVFSLLFAAGMLIIPASIAIAILRYRLYDIDVIIRRTVQYAILTGLLALVYLGSVLLLQNLFDQMAGEQSPVVIVISTLLIVALFNPLRVRIQRVIDRRLFRRKYNADQTLAQFAAVARDVVDVDQLEAYLLDVVDETLQPEGAAIWMKPS